jgi:hypothetical protein
VRFDEAGKHQAPAEIDRDGRWPGRGCRIRVAADEGDPVAPTTSASAK